MTEEMCELWRWITKCFLSLRGTQRFHTSSLLVKRVYRQVSVACQCKYLVVHAHGIHRLASIPMSTRIRNFCINLKFHENDKNSEICVVLNSVSLSPCYSTLMHSWGGRAHISSTNKLSVKSVNLSTVDLFRAFYFWT